MSELILEKHLCEPAEEDEVRNIARVRTLTVLSRLNSERKGIVLKFLHESKHIEKGKSIINLDGVDLSGSSLGGVNLSKANLTRANLKDATGIIIEELEKKAKS